MIDVQAAFADAEDDFIDECHFNPRGHARMAALVAEALVAGDVVERASFGSGR